MAKEKDKQLAFYYYVEKQKTAKETAKIIGVTETTLGRWVAKNGWRQQREARALSSSARCHNLEMVISDLANQRIENSKNLKEAIASGDKELASDIRKQLAVIDDGASKWNKTLENAKKDSKISLSIYLDVMEQIFNALRNYDEKLYLATLDFQTEHVHTISSKIDRV